MHRADPRTVVANAGMTVVRISPGILALQGTMIAMLIWRFIAVPKDFLRMIVPDLLANPVSQWRR